MKEDKIKEMQESVNKVVGMLNGLDSNKERLSETLSVLNEVIAGVDLSKTEKAGTLVYLMSKRIN